MQTSCKHQQATNFRHRCNLSLGPRFEPRPRTPRIPALAAAFDAIRDFAATAIDAIAHVLQSISAGVRAGGSVDCVADATGTGSNNITGGVYYAAYCCADLGEVLVYERDHGVWGQVTGGKRSKFCNSAIWKEVLFMRAQHCIRKLTAPVAPLAAPLPS